MQTEVNIKDFLPENRKDIDATEAVFFALERCKEVQNPVLVFPKGTYHYWPDKAYERYYFISNNTHGLKRITFPMIDFENLTIDGNGSEFIFHGRIVPFVMDGSKNVVIKNLSIDYIRTFYSQGEIIDSDYNYLDLKISKKEFPYRIERQEITFYDENWESYPIRNLLEIDRTTLTPAYKAGDEWLNHKEVFVEEKEEEIVRFQGEGIFKKLHKKGNIMVISHEHRVCPAFFLTNSSNVKMENINIFHAGSMGVIAQDTNNISLNNVNIMLREGTRRVVSTNADAIHFVNCTGNVTIENCIFENQKDDPVNIHGIYTTISKIYEPNILEVEYMHYEQVGVPIYHPGDIISIINRESLIGYHNAVVKEVKVLNQKFVRLEMEEDIASSIKIGDAVENISRMPNVIIRNCKAGNNRARGFLITTPGNVIIENNDIYSAGSGILIEGDANYWFESGGVRNIEIKNNRFINCCYGPWGDAVIYINPRVSPDESYAQCYHRNIMIENNYFKAFEYAILVGHSIDGLKFINNVIEKTDTYIPYRTRKNNIDIWASKNINISGNKLDGFDEKNFISENIMVNSNVKIL